jgi:hypothetical protein
MDKSNTELEKQLNSQKKEISSLKKKISSIENFLGDQYNDFNTPVKNIGEENTSVTESEEVREEKPSNPIDFTTLLTSIGVIGLVIGLVSFFFYAVTNGWVSELMQIFIGVSLGLVVMTLGLKWYDQKPNWSTTLIGGGIFIIMISLIIGVKQYEVLSKLFALLIAVGVIVYTLYISMKLDSRIISYFGLIGGFFIPVISGLSDPIFTYSYLVLFLLAILYVSFMKNWSEIRYASFLLMIIYNSIFFDAFGSNYSNGLGPTFSLISLVCIVLIFHVSCFIYSLKEKVSMKDLDVVLLNINSLVFSITLVYLLFDVLTKVELGLMIVLIGLLFLGEYFLIKSSKVTNIMVNNSLLSSTILFVNVGLAVIFNYSSDYLFYAIFTSQWIVYMYLSKISQNKLFKVYGYISLLFLMLWYIYDLQFDLGMAHGTFFILALLALCGISYTLSKYDMEKSFHQMFSVAFLFFWIYSLSKYLAFFSISSTVLSLILSLLWLIYSLVLVVKTHNNEKFSGVLENLSKVVLGFVLLKIAFYDIIQLSGVVRIIGFMLFGGFLVLGGFLLKKEK